MGCGPEGHKELDTTEVTLACTALDSRLTPQLQSSKKESSDVAYLLRDRQIVSQYSFISLSLVVSEIEQLFMCLRAICSSFSVDSSYLLFISLLGCWFFLIYF